MMPPLADDPLSLRPDPEQSTSLSFGDVAGQLSLDLLTALLSQPHGASIDLLDLSRQHLSSEVVELLARNQKLLAELRWLDLSFNPIRGAGLAALLTTPFQALRGLKLEHISMWRGECHIMREINNLSKALQHLDLAANHLTDQGIEQVAQWPLLATLGSLGLRDNSLTDASLDALINSPTLERGSLRALDLSHNRLGDDALAKFIHAPTFDSITHLAISHTAPRRATLEALGARCVNLESLLLSETRCGTLAMRRFMKQAGEGCLERLKVLNLNACALKDAGLQALLERDNLGALHTLILSRNDLTDRAVSKLPESAMAASLRHLELDANGALTLGAILPLLDPRALPSLQTLSLNDTALSAEEYSLVEHITREQGQRLHTWRRP